MTVEGEGEVKGGGGYRGGRVVEMDDPSGVRGLHQEGGLLHNVMPHQQNEIGVVHAHMNVVSVAYCSCAHVPWTPCRIPRI